VVCVGRKAWDKLAQVCIRETNESEPFEDASLTRQVSSNQGRVVHLGQVRGEPDDCADGDRRKGGVKRMQAVAWNCRNQSLRWKGRSSSGQNRKASVPMRSTGTDRLVGAMKARNGAGAKGSGQAVA
jgi:hypothetical protein